MHECREGIFHGKHTQELQVNSHHRIPHSLSSCSRLISCHAGAIYCESFSPSFRGAMMTSVFFTLSCVLIITICFCSDVYTQVLCYAYMQNDKTTTRVDDEEEKKREVWKTEIILVFQHVYYIYPPVCRVGDGNDAVCGRIFVVRFKWFTRRVSIHSLLFFLPFQPPIRQTTASLSARIIQRASHIILMMMMIWSCWCCWIQVSTSCPGEQMTNAIYSHAICPSFVWWFATLEILLYMA